MLISHGTVTPQVYRKADKTRDSSWRGAARLPGACSSFCMPADIVSAVILWTVSGPESDSDPCLSGHVSVVMATHSLTLRLGLQVSSGREDG